MAPELAAAAHQTEDSTMKGDGIGVQAIHEVGKGMREVRRGEGLGKGRGRRGDEGRRHT